MKKILVLAAALALAASSCALALPLVLTEPQKSGGPGVFDTFAARVSAPEQDFTKEELTLDELSTILWAATGQNGTESWTVPVIMGRDPNVSVYVMLKDGGYLYNWEKNALMEINNTGAMSQNAALAAQALGLDARFTTSFNRSAIEETLNLGPVMNVMGVLAVGRQ